MEPEDLERALRDAAGRLPDATPEYPPFAAAGRARRRRRAVAVSVVAVLAAGGTGVAALQGGGGTSRLVGVPGPSPSSESGSPTPSTLPSPTTTESTPPPMILPGPSDTASPAVSPSPSPSCVPAIEPYDDPPAGASGAYPDRFWFATHGGLYLAPTVDASSTPPWPARLVIKGTTTVERQRGYGMGTVARTRSGRFFVTYAQPCGSGIYTFTGHGPATLFSTLPVEILRYDSLLFSPDERYVAVYPWWSFGPRWEPEKPYHVTILSATTGEIVRTVDIPGAPPVEWLADGTGFLYVASDDTLHRIHLDGTEGPVTTPPVGCQFWSAARGWSGQLMGGLGCTGQASRVVLMAEDGTIGAEVGARAGIAMLVAPSGTAAITAPGSNYPLVLVAQGESPRTLKHCTGMPDCQGSVSTGFAW